MRIDSGKVNRIGVGLAVPEDYRIIDCSNLVVVPGFVNTHHHFYQTLTRNLPAVQNAKLFDWLVYLYEVWKYIDEEAIYYSSLLAMSELLKTQFERLLAASALAREIRHAMINEAKSMERAAFLEAQPLNYFILKFVYAPAEEGTTEFKKFNEWKNEGYTIKKGSKAFPVWSQPTKREKKEQRGKTRR